MKKLSLIVAAAILFSFFAGVPLTSAYSVIPTPTDFAGGCLALTGTSVKLNSQNIGVQILKPTKSHITKITVRGGYMEVFNITVFFQKKNGNDLGPVLTSKSFANNNTATEEQSYPAVISGIDIPVTIGSEYQITVLANSGTFYWYSAPNCDATGYNMTTGTYSMEDDMLAYLQGITPATTTTPTNTATTTSSSTGTTNIKTAPVVSPDKLAVPLNFRVDRDLETEKIFAWDLNTEKDLAGYVLYVYETGKDVPVEIIDIPDKLQDNYNLVLTDHSLLKYGEYDVKLAAKNTAGAVSEKTQSLKIKFTEPVIAVEAASATTQYLANPYVLGGFGLLLVILIALLVYMERKFHGLGNFWNKIRKPKTDK